jgi:hypothetical protein
VWPDGQRDPGVTAVGAEEQQRAKDHDPTATFAGPPLQVPHFVCKAEVSPVDPTLVTSRFRFHDPLLTRGASGLPLLEIASKSLFDGDDAVRNGLAESWVIACLAGLPTLQAVDGDNDVLL